MIDWNKRNGGFLSPESVYEDQLSNLSMQINEKDKQLEKYKNVIDKIKDDLKKTIQYNVKSHDIFGNRYINVDLDHIKHLLELLEEVE